VPQITRLGAAPAFVQLLDAIRRSAEVHARLEVAMSEPAQNREPAAAPLRTLLGLKMPDGPGRIIVWDTEEIVVGRSSESDIVVEDTDTSRRHALFTRSAAGFQVEDLGTSNGTRVNGAPLASPHLLRVKDAVSVGDLTITFIQSRRDPAGLGLEVAYASDLKGFAARLPANQDPSATTLGLTEVAGPFAVGAVGDFAAGDAPAAPAPAPVAAPKSRDLDLELAEFLPSDGTPASTTPGATVSLQLELEGLTPDLQRMLESLRDKVIELPALRIRVKG
jgi:hypothetical protein